MWWLVFWLGIILYMMFIAALIWYMICNGKTLKQKLALIELSQTAFNPDDFSDRFDFLQGLDKVGYNEHLWALFTFKNPHDLYPPMVQEVWPNV